MKSLCLDTSLSPFSFQCCMFLHGNNEIDLLIFQDYFSYNDSMYYLLKFKMLLSHFLNAHKNRKNAMLLVVH